MIEQLPWSEFRKRLQWKQGEHVALIAPTGAGKTTAMESLLPFRQYSIFFGTKPDDKLYRRIQNAGYVRVDSIREVRPWQNKILLWPKHRKTIPETLNHQREVFADAMNTVVQQRGWTVWFDECKYMSQMLKLQTEITYCLEQLRSVHATTVSGAQRPVWLPRSVLSNATHVFLWRTTDREDAKRLSDIGGVDNRLLASEAQTLGKHEFIYVYTRGTEVQMVRSQVGRG